MTKNSVKAEVRPYDECIDIYAFWNGCSGTARMDWETAKRIVRELEDAIDLRDAQIALAEPGSIQFEKMKGLP